MAKGDLTPALNIYVQVSILLNENIIAVIQVEKSKPNWYLCFYS